MANKDNHKNVIQSLDRGLIILEELSKSVDQMGLPELADVLDVDPSTVYRLLGTLLNRGYVVQDPISKKYTIGLKVIQLSRRAIDNVHIRVISKPYVRRLVEESGESTNLGVFTDKFAVCIDHKTSPYALAVTNEIGEGFVYHATAMGKVLLAFQPEMVRHEILKDYSYDRFTPKTISDSMTFINQLDIIRKNFYAVDDEERFLGVRCIAAPIFDYTEKLVAGIGISAPSSRMTLDRLGSLIKLVKKTAFEISIQSGYPAEKSYPDNEYLQKVQAL